MKAMRRIGRLAARPWPSLGAALGLLILALAVLPAQGGGTITVDSTGDDDPTGSADGDCTLREALYAANNDIAVDTCPAGNGVDRIVLPAGTYTLSRNGFDELGIVGDLDILEDVILVGAGPDATIIDGNGLVMSDKIFELDEFVSVRMEGLQIANGNMDAGYSSAIHTDFNSSLDLRDCKVLNNYNGALAGAIWSDGTLYVQDCLFSGNVSNNGGGAIYSSVKATIVDSTFEFNQAMDGNGPGYGGAIRSAGSLRVTGSTFRNNSADGDGGAIQAVTQPLTVSDSVFADNDSGSDGGAIYASGYNSSLVNSTFQGNSAANSGGALRLQGTFWLYNLTVAGNSADSDADETGDGGGISKSSIEVTVANSIIAGNADDSPTSNDYPDCDGSYTSSGYNLIGANDGCSGFTTTGDMAGTIGSPIDPLLSPPADNGGSTQTMALAFNSPAVDAGNPAGCTYGIKLGTLEQAELRLHTDQRAYVRHAEGGSTHAYCDIGAFEYAAPVPNTPPGLLLNLSRSPAVITKGSPASGSNQWFARVALSDVSGDPGLAFHYVVWLQVPEGWTLPWATQYSFSGDFANSPLSQDYAALPWVGETENCPFGGPAESGYKWRAFRGSQESLPSPIDRVDNQVNLRGGLGVPSGEASGVYTLRTIVGSYYDSDTLGSPTRYRCDHLAETVIVVP